MIERRWIISLFELLKAHRNLFELNQIAFIFLYYKFSCYSLSKKSVPGLRIFHYDNDYDNVKYVLLLEKKKYNSTQPEKNKSKFNFYWAKIKTTMNISTGKVEFVRNYILHKRVFPAPKFSI